MCLGVPGKIIEINTEESWAVIEAFGVKSKVYTPLIEEEITLGDYLLVHAGYAIGKIDIEEAGRTLKMLEEIAQIDT
jgi:hydrogenase expression/formation protein HypC